jgi:hypothetical protein
MFLLFLSTSAYGVELLTPLEVLTAADIVFVGQEPCQPPDVLLELSIGDGRRVSFESTLGRHEVIVWCEYNTPTAIYVYPTAAPGHRYLVSLMEFGLGIDERRGDRWVRVCDTPQCSRSVPEAFAARWSADFADGDVLGEAVDRFMVQHPVPESFEAFSRVAPGGEGPPLAVWTREGLARYTLADSEPSAFLTAPMPTRRRSSPGVGSSMPLLSPDGETVALTNGTFITLVDTAGGQPQPIARTSTPNGYLLGSWSPSGRRLLVANGRRIQVLATDGTLLAERTDRFKVAGWDGDDVVLTHTPSALQRWDLRTGAVSTVGTFAERVRNVWVRGGEVIARNADGVTRDGQPWFTPPSDAYPLQLSPDGQRMAMTRQNQLLVVEAGSDTPRTLVDSTSRCTFDWYTPERLMFVVGSGSGPINLVDLGGEVTRLPLQGEPIRRGQHR